MDDMDMATRCVYAMWALEQIDSDVRQLLKGKTIAQLLALGGRIAKNPKHSNTSARVFARAVAMRLEE